MRGAMGLRMHTSRLLPVAHGFTTRHGGVSEGPYASLNLSFSVGDLPDKVANNIRAVARAAGVLPFQIQTAKQVHGARVLEEVVPQQDSELTLPRAEADALWTSTPDAAVAVRVADCVPVILVDPVARRVAAVHSGWRGTELKIAARAVKALEAHGSRASRLLAAIGPSIGACCYAVSPELAARFSAMFGSEVLRSAAGQPHLDLARAVRDTLREAGLPERNIDVLPDCTSCSRDHFFSHRRDKGVTGRQMAFAVCRF